MENGRIEPLRALPVHREAQPCLQPPQWAKYIQCTLIFPLISLNLEHAHIFSDLLGGPPWRVLAPSCSKSAGEGLEAGGPPGNPPKSGPERAGKDGLGGPLEAPGGPLEAPGPRPLGGPWRAGCWEPPQNLA